MRLKLFDKNQTLVLERDEPGSNELDNASAVSYRGRTYGYAGLFRDERPYARWEERGDVYHLKEESMASGVRGQLILDVDWLEGKLEPVSEVLSLPDAEELAREILKQPRFEKEGTGLIIVPATIFKRG